MKIGKNTCGYHVQLGRVEAEVGKLLLAGPDFWLIVERLFLLLLVRVECFNKFHGI